MQMLQARLHLRRRLQQQRLQLQQKARSFYHLKNHGQ
jgi:hypothetical protein